MLEDRQPWTQTPDPAPKDVSKIFLIYNASDAGSVSESAKREREREIDG